MPGLDDLVHLNRPATGEPQGALVLMHGRGTSEHDLYPLLDELDPEGRLLGVCPRAPLALPPNGNHWYVVRRVGFPDEATFLPTFARLDAWLRALAEETGIPAERTILGGFSQGAVMAWSMGLGPDRPRPAGVLALSGFMPRVEGFPLSTDALAGLPVAIAHGTYDPVISIDFGREAKSRAEAAGAEVTYMETPVPHGVDPRWLEAARKIRG